MWTKLGQVAEVVYMLHPQPFVSMDGLECCKEELAGFICVLALDPQLLGAGLSLTVDKLCNLSKPVSLTL